MPIPVSLMRAIANSTLPRLQYLRRDPPLSPRGGLEDIRNSGAAGFSDTGHPTRYRSVNGALVGWTYFPGPFEDGYIILLACGGCP